jgi:hypothetical protein
VRRWWREGWKWVAHYLCSVCFALQDAAAAVLKLLIILNYAGGVGGDGMRRPVLMIHYIYYE